jgi:hypothetical protein
MEDVMNKSLLAASAALAITTLFVSGAQAGCGGGGYDYGYSYQSEWHPTRHHVRVARREPVQVAKADDKPANAPVNAVTENSSIATVTAKASESKPTEIVKTAAVNAAKPAVDASTAKVGCMKYFPSVGMTLTVPCE